MQRSFSRVNSALAGIGVGLSFAGLAAFTKAGLDSIAALDDLSEKTSLSVETLSQLQEVARVGGTALETVASGASRFAKSVSEAAGGNKELIRYFEQIGISAQDLKNQNFDQIFVRFAQAIAGAEDKTNALALAQKLAGKSASELLPFYNDLAQMGLGVARVTTEQAAAADKFQKDLARLASTAAEARDSIVGRMLPALSAIAEEFKRAVAEGNNFLMVMARTANVAIGGDESLKRDRQFIDNVNRKLRLERQIAEIENGTNKSLAARHPATLERMRSELNATNARIEALQKERQEAERTAAAQDKPSAGRTVGPVVDSGAAGRAESERKRREAELKRLQQEQTREAQRIAELQAAGAAQFERDASEAFNYVADMQKKLNDRAYFENIYGEDRLLGMSIEDVRAFHQSVLDGADAIMTAGDEAARAYAGFDEQGRSLIDSAEKGIDVAKELGLTFSSAFEDSVIGGKKFREVLEGIAQDVARIVLRKNVTEPLANAVGKFDFGSIFKGLFGGSSSPVPSAPYYGPAATGIEYVPRDGFAFLHKGETVRPASEREGVMIEQNINVDSRSDMASINHAMAVARQQAAAVVEDRRRRRVS